LVEFPRTGDRYWNRQTLEGVEGRYGIKLDDVRRIVEERERMRLGSSANQNARL
jgi:hypothetical protein